MSLKDFLFFVVTTLVALNLGGFCAFLVDVVAVSVYPFSPVAGILAIIAFYVVSVCTFLLGKKLTGFQFASKE